MGLELGPAGQRELGKSRVGVPGKAKAGGWFTSALWGVRRWGSLGCGISNDGHCSCHLLGTFTIHLTLLTKFSQ